MGMSRAEEQVLLKRAMRGDRDAFAACIRAHQRSLYAYLLRMCGKPDVAEDICQDAFVRVLGNLDKFDFRYRFSTWLFTIAKRLYLNRAAKMSPSFDTDTAEGRSFGWNAVDATALADERRGVARSALAEAMGGLTVEQRETLVLFHQQGWPVARIAEHLDMPQGTVKSHLHRGRRRLRGLLEQSEASMARLASVMPELSVDASRSATGASSGGMGEES